MSEQFASTFVTKFLKNPVYLVMYLFFGLVRVDFEFACHAIICDTAANKYQMKSLFRIVMIYLIPKRSKFRYTLLLHCYAHSLWSLLLSFSYRYYILFHPAPKMRTIILMFIAISPSTILQTVSIKTSKNVKVDKCRQTTWRGFEIKPTLYASAICLPFTLGVSRLCPNLILTFLFFDKYPDVGILP